MTRDLIIQVIREVVRGWPIEDVETYAAALPLQVTDGAEVFCDENELGRWFYMQILGHNISAAAELYAFIPSTQTVDQLKEAGASGDKSNATT